MKDECRRLLEGKRHEASTVYSTTGYKGDSEPDTVHNNRFLADHGTREGKVESI